MEALQATLTRMAKAEVPVSVGKQSICLIQIPVSGGIITHLPTVSPVELPSLAPVMLHPQPSVAPEITTV